jgi:predicted amidohydrolase
MEQNEITRRGFLARAAIGATALIVGDHRSAGATAAVSPVLMAKGGDGETLNIALLQMTSAITHPEATPPWNMIKMDTASVRERQERNIQIAEAACREAAAQGADIALFPEMWNIGYAMFDEKKPGAREDWLGLAVDADSAYVRHFASLAKELNMAIAATYLQKWNPAPRNAVSVISRTGEIAMTYAKVHTCDFSDEAALAPGDEFPVCELDTRVGPVRVGCMICFDFQFPESSRILMLNGAEVILVPVATGLPDMYTDQVKVRAFDNAVAVAVANYANFPFDGGSVAYDAKGYGLVQPLSEGVELVQIARLNLRELREYRKETIFGNAFRRPRKYKEMVADNVAPAFARNDFLGRPFDRQVR